jgi:hypothetical protein
MKCPEVKNALVAYMDGEVMPSERTLIESHLAGCESCERELSALSSSRRMVAASLKTMAVQATPLPHAWAHLRATIAKDGAGAEKQHRSHGKGEHTMRLRWRVALGTAGAVVLAAAVIAAVPSSRAAAGGFFADVFNIQVGPMTKLAYLPVGFESGPVAAAGSASISAKGDEGQQEEQTLYKSGDQFLLVKTSTDQGQPLPEGRPIDVNGQAAVLATGLQGSADVMAPVLDAAPVESTGGGSAPAAGSRPLTVTGSGSATVVGGNTVITGQDGPVTVDGGGLSTAQGDGAGPSTQTNGPLPEVAPISYADANSLTWVVDGTRVELLSNLPVAELQKIAEGLSLNK